MTNKFKSIKTIKMIFLILGLLLIIFLIGFIGYMFLFGMNFIDAFYNTALTVTTLGVDPHIKTSGEKIFTGIYAIIAGGCFISLIGILIAYIIATHIV